MIRLITDLVRRLWAIPFLRFLVVGGINTLFGYTVFALFILLQFHYVVATLLAQICGVLFNFKTTGTIVFKNRKKRLILRFTIVYLITYLLNIGLLKLFNLAGMEMLAAQAIIIFPIAFLTFSLMRKFVFNNSSEKQDKLPKPSVW